MVLTEPKLGVWDLGIGDPWRGRCGVQDGGSVH